MIEVCPYCGEDRGDKISCCGEVHFVSLTEEDYERHCNGGDVLE